MKNSITSLHTIRNGLYVRKNGSVVIAENVTKLLKENNKGLTTLQICIAITSKTGVPCMPSDLCALINRLEKQNVIYREGVRKNPIVGRARVSRLAHVFKIKAKKGKV